MRKESVFASFMDEWSNLEQAIEQLAATGAVEVHEDGQWLAGLDRFRSEVRRKGKAGADSPVVFRKQPGAHHHAHFCV
ncbi:MAG TPA: hypothetical protein VND42_06395 [Candidatus Acidoferrales bacterium]|nr:hypothetical protein [Candidatus Acidoferrales bacterium]